MKETHTKSGPESKGILHVLFLFLALPNGAEKLLIIVVDLAATIMRP